MREPNPDRWAQSHLPWLALSRWDNEGGASPFRLTAGAPARAASQRGGVDFGAAAPRSRLSRPGPGSGA